MQLRPNARSGQNHHSLHKQSPITAANRSSGMSNSHGGGGRKVAFWHSSDGLQALSLWMVIAVALTGGVAVITGFVGGVAGWRSSVLSQIDADARNKQADERIAGATAEAERAREGAATAHAAAMAAQARLREAEAQIADANARAEEAGERTEQLRAINVRMQQALAPRRLVMQSRNGDEQVRHARFSEVERYSGTLVLIQSVPDFEAQTLAGDIAETLGRAGWHVMLTDEAHSHIPNGLIWEGVQVMSLEQSPFRPDDPPPGESPFRDVTISRAGTASTALVNLLQMDLGPPLGPLMGVRWEAQYEQERMRSSILRHGFRFPDGAVLVLVGMKPLDASMTELGFEAAQIARPQSHSH